VTHALRLLAGPLPEAPQRLRYRPSGGRARRL